MGMNTTRSSAQDVLTNHAVDVVDSQDSKAVAICRCGTEVPELEHVDHQLAALGEAGCTWWPRTVQTRTPRHGQCSRLTLPTDESGGFSCLAWAVSVVITPPPP